MSVKNVKNLFKIGTSHEVCQDYSLSGQTSSGIAYGIVSDGSSSCPMTDVGSRLISLNLEKSLEYANRFRLSELSDDAYFKNYATYLPLVDCFHQLDQLRIITDCLTATLLNFQVGEDSYFVGMAGDGVFGKFYKNGDAEIVAITYSENYPMYPIYTYDTKMLDQYKNLKQSKIIETYRFNLSNPTDLGYQVCLISDFATFDYFKGGTDGLSSLFIASDGLLSLQNQSCREQLVRLFAKLGSFPSTQGEFLQRKWNFMLKKDNYSFSDDVSIASAVFL